jgi:hypothetical protein
MKAILTDASHSMSSRHARGWKADAGDPWLGRYVFSHFGLQRTGRPRPHISCASGASRHARNPISSEYNVAKQVESARFHLSEAGSTACSSGNGSYPFVRKPRSAFCRCSITATIDSRLSVNLSSGRSSRDKARHIQYVAEGSGRCLVEGSMAAFPCIERYFVLRDLELDLSRDAQNRITIDLKLCNTRTASVRSVRFSQ